MLAEPPVHSPASVLIAPKVTLRGEKFLVLEDEAAKKAGALFLPTESLKHTRRGTVVVCGRKTPKDIKQGMRIVWQFDQADEARIGLGDQKYLLIHPDEVDVVLPERIDVDDELNHPVTSLAPDQRYIPCREDS